MCRRRIGVGNVFGASEQIDDDVDIVGVIVDVVVVVVAYSKSS